MPEYREVVWQGRTVRVDADGRVLPNPDVDMDVYDAQLVEWGYEFEPDPPEDEEPPTELTFLAEAER